MTDPLLSNVLRLRTKAKKVGNTRIRTPFRHRRKGIKLTKDEREERQRGRDDKRSKFNASVAQARDTIMKLAEDFPGHDKDYYYRHLMQLPKVAEAKRPITEWHAFVHLKMKERNQSIVETQGEEARRDRVSSDTVKEIAAEWAELSRDQKTDLTAETIKELEERRANRVEGKHNTQLAACHDARATLKNIKSELENLHARTGLAILLIATRGDIEAFGNPVTYYSEERIAHFMESTTGCTLEDTAIRMEAYCVTGLEGVVTNQLRRTQDLKSKLQSLIVAKLQAASNGAINRMNYVNFDEAITAKGGIILENWPIAKFQSPSGMSHAEAEICFRAWDSGTTHFRQLSKQEWEDWLEARYAISPTGETTVGDDSVSRPSTADPDLAPSAPSSAAAPSPTEIPTEPASSAVTSATATVGINAAPAGGSPLAAQPTTSPGEKRGAEGAADGPPAKRARTEPMTINFVNSVSPAVGAAFVVPKATRKKRSDAGKPRGPRKQRAATASENAPVVEGATVAERPKPRPRKKASPQEASATPGPSSSSPPA